MNAFSNRAGSNNTKPNCLHVFDYTPLASYLQAVEPVEWQGVRADSMPYTTEQLLKFAADSFIESCFKFVRPVTTSLAVAANEIEVACNKVDYWSTRRLEQSQSWTQVYGKFLSFKKHFATAPDRDGKYVHYFLCSLETFPRSEFERAVYQATALIDADYESARTLIGNKMHSMIQENALGLPGRAPLMLSV